MLKRGLLVLLLLGFFINITHPYIIDANGHKNESMKEYVQEINQPVGSGDLCDIHHLFHISFILANPQINIEEIFVSQIVDFAISPYYPPLLEPSFKPPIV